MTTGQARPEERAQLARPYSIRTFSQERAILEGGRLVSLAALGRPPHTPLRQKFLRRGVSPPLKKR
jgi:hypothetical protein